VILSLLFGMLLAAEPNLTTGPANVVVVVNETSALSKTVGEYYSRRRFIPQKNVCTVRTTEDEEIDRVTYENKIAKPLLECLRSRQLVESTLYIVTTAGVPLRVAGSGGLDGDVASVDSELTLLYYRLHGANPPVKGIVPNPFFGQSKKTFSHPAFPIYLVTRLAGYDFADIRGLVDRSLAARNRGKFVIDMSDDTDSPGNNWLRDAAIKIPNDRLVLDQSTKVLYNEKQVIGYAAWGSNDKNRHNRMLGFEWLPGAIMTEYVSTNARTFKRPPDKWNIGTWDNHATFFSGSPQTMTADYIHEGVTGASGHVAEPYLHLNPRPDILLPAYFAGRNLAESYYLSIPGLSWQNVFIGDPLCSLGKP
jgi:uncharacterized protein (TIGR03790 family)